MKTRTNYGSTIDILPPGKWFKSPIPEQDQGKTYYRYRSGGYDPASGTYGRCGTRKDAETIIARGHL